MEPGISVILLTVACERCRPEKHSYPGPKYPVRIFRSILVVTVGMLTAEPPLCRLPIKAKVAAAVLNSAVCQSETNRVNIRTIILALALTGVSNAFAYGQRSAFAVYPAKEPWASPDGRFLIRSEDRPSAPSELSGQFHSLFVEDRATGESRKLCDYLRRVTVAWAANHFILVTDYFTGRDARVLVFAADQGIAPIKIDRGTLYALLPESQGVHLVENDHVYVAAWQLNGDTLALQVWGHGRRDANGFRWSCSYSLVQGTASCRDPR